jgi:hypothetical protein
MKSYRLDQDKLKEQKRNIILMYGITLVVLLVLNYFMYRGREVTSNTLLMLGLIVVMFAFFGWNALRQRQAIWDKYEIIVDETGIRQTQPKAADIFLPRADISDVKESKFGLTLMVKEGQPVMGIPKLLTPADYEEIKGIVTGWLRDSKPVVVDEEVVEDAQVVFPGDEMEQEPDLEFEVEPEGLSVEMPEDQLPPESPEA